MAYAIADVGGMPVEETLLHFASSVGSWTSGNSETDRSPLHSSRVTQLLEKSWLARCIIGIMKVAQADANQAKALLFAKAYALAQ